MNRPTTQRRPAWAVPALIGLIAVVAIALVIISQTGDDTSAAPPANQAEQTAPADQPTEQDSQPDAERADANTGESGDANAPPTTVDRGDTPDLTFIERRDEADPLAVGPVDAPVTLVVFSDFQCPYCAKWSDETFPALESYIDADDLRVEWRDVNIFGEASERGARATYAAALQGHFTAMKSALFADGMARAANELTDERLATLARDLGLDGDQFDADYQAASTKEEIARNQQLGLDIGAFSTPAFILGGQPLVGAQPTEVFTAAMDEALAAAHAED